MNSQSALMHNKFHQEQDTEIHRKDEEIATAQRELTIKDASKERDLAAKDAQIQQLQNEADSHIRGLETRLEVVNTLSGLNLYHYPTMREEIL